MEHRVCGHLPESYERWGTIRTMEKFGPVAGQPYTFQIEVRLNRTLHGGQSIECWAHFVSDMDYFQIEDPKQPAYFTCDAGRLEVESHLGNLRVHGPAAFFPYRRYAGVRLAEAAVAGTPLVFRIHNVTIQSYEESLFNLRFAVLKGDTLEGYVGDAFYEVKGDMPRYLRLVAPTCVAVGETFEAKIVVCDRFGNKTGIPLEGLEFDLALQGADPASSFEGVRYDPERRLHFVTGLHAEQPGTLYLQAALRGLQGITGVSNPIVVRKDWDERVYWGDPHQHAYYHDGRGTPHANYAYAIHTGCLDFCAVTPHEQKTFGPGSLHLGGMPAQKGWEEMIEAAKEYASDRFVTILGSEPGSPGGFAGHMNAYFFELDNRPELERLEGAPQLESPRERYEQYLAELENSNGEVLLLPHAHAGHGPARFDVPPRPDYQTNAEICSVHGVFDDYYKGWLRKGHIMGVHGGGDNHMASTGNGRPGNHYTNTNGLTGACSPELTRRGIWNAYKQRRTYAVTGNQRIFLEFAANDVKMGGTCKDVKAARKLRLTVAGTAPILKVELLKNCEPFETWMPELGGQPLLRLVWADTIRSRRVDDSETTGTIRLKKGDLTVVCPLLSYHTTDRFQMNEGRVLFRSNAYSGTMRGVLLQTPEAADSAVFEIHDKLNDTVLLDESIPLDLTALPAEIVRPLEPPARGKKPAKKGGKKRAAEQPQFCLQANWVDPDWPKTAQVEWTDKDGAEDYYYVRVEQIDGNIAWSSPVWFRK